MEKNPAIDATLPKRNKKKCEIWTAEMLMQAIETNSCYIVINKIIERVSVEALDFMDRKDIITIFPTQKRNNTTVVVMKTPRTETSNRKVYIPSHVGKCLKELKAEQDHTKEILGNEYKDYNLVLAMTFGMPIGASHVRTKMKQIIKKEGLPDVVFHSLRHTSVTYKLKLSGGDIKAVQGDSSHAQADMVTEVYGHILDEDRKKNAQLMENAFYNKENLNPDIHGASGIQNNNNNNMISVPEGVDADMLMKVLGNPEMAALLTSLAKSMNLNDPPEMVHRSANSVYSVISPEGCASILWKDSSKAADAAEALRLTAQDLFDLGVIERIIRQPKAGDQAMFESLKMLIKRTFEKNLALDDEELLNARYERFRKIGRPE